MNNFIRLLPIDLIKCIDKYTKLTLKDQVEKKLYHLYEIRHSDISHYFPNDSVDEIVNILYKLCKENRATCYRYHTWRRNIPKKIEKSMRYYIRKKIKDQGSIVDPNTERFGFFETLMKMVDEGIIYECGGYDMVYKVYTLKS